METERIILRERTVKRLQAVLNYSAEKQALFFGLENEQDIRKEIELIKNGQYTNYYSGIYFDLVLKETKKVIGSAGYHTWWRAHDRAEVGYGLYKEEHRRQGYMNEIIPWLLDYGFHKMKLNRIEAKTAQDNVASIALLKKFGFLKEGTIHAHYKMPDGRYADDFSFYLLKEESSLSR